VIESVWVLFHNQDLILMRCASRALACTLALQRPGYVTFKTVLRLWLELVACAAPVIRALRADCKPSTLTSAKAELTAPPLSPPNTCQRDSKQQQMDHGAARGMQW
jgi:hypothetical protein